VVDGLLGLPLLALHATEPVVDVCASLGLVLPERGENLLIVGEGGAPVLEAEAHVGQTPDRDLIREVQLMSRRVRLESFLVLLEGRADLPELVLHGVLLGSLALAALAND